MLRSFQFRRWFPSAGQQYLHGVRSIRQQPLPAAIDALERRTLFSTFTVSKVTGSGKPTRRSLST